MSLCALSFSPGEALYFAVENDLSCSATVKIKSLQASDFPHLVCEFLMVYTGFSVAVRCGGKYEDIAEFSGLSDGCPRFAAIRIIAVFPIAHTLNSAVNHQGRSECKRVHNGTVEYYFVPLFFKQPL